MIPLGGLESVTSELAERLLIKAPSEQCYLDLKSAWLSKRVCDMMALIVAFMRDILIERDVLPICHKIGKVGPLLKKLTDHPDLLSFTNFQPKLSIRVGIASCCWRPSEHFYQQNLMPRFIQAVVCSTPRDGLFDW